MIDDARDIPDGVTLHAQVCIVGGGAAGITLALELGRAGREAVVLPGGGWRETLQARDLHEASRETPGNHEPMTVNRRRMWGGATSAWGGRCVPFDPIDFEARAWVPDSGWPISYHELARFYGRAVTMCVAGENVFSAHDVAPDGPLEIIEGLDTAALTSARLNRWSPPIDFARHYDTELRASPNIRVLLHASATHLQADAGGRALSHVQAAHPRGSRFRVEAGQYVLACGSLENARLLLSADDVQPDGLGNEHDCVGRYYQSHVTGQHAVLRITKDEARLSFKFFQDREGVYCRKRFWVTPDAQRREGIGNITMELHEPVEDMQKKHSPLFSSIILGRLLAQGLRHPSPARLTAFYREHHHALGHHLCNSAGNLRQWIPEAISIARRRLLQSRRCPGIILNADSRSFLFACQSEHAPNRSSRVFLATDRDALGLRRLAADPRFSDVDVETQLAAHRIMGDSLRHASIGHLEYDEGQIRERLQERFRNFDSIAHQIGTTRMGSDPRTSVVDSNARVWGVENLYVAGASVFPTSSQANPTLTIVALTQRLAEHLQRH